MTRLTDRTASYFLERFRSATLAGAVERAAASLLAPSLKGFDTTSAAAVKLDAVLEDNRIREGEALPAAGCAEGKLMPDGPGFIMQIKRSQSLGRRRFSIAHEIAHSLFYSDSGRGQRHQVGALSAEERRTEETICNRVAAALLIPSVVASEALPPEVLNDPAAILWELDRLAARLQVSLGALVARLSHIRLPRTRLMLTNLQFENNRHTGGEPKLRVTSTRNLSGDRDAPTFWPNVSSETIRLSVASDLFHSWHEEVLVDRQGSAGRFSLGLHGQLVRVKMDEDIRTFMDVPQVWVKAPTGWVKRKLTARVACVLYAPPRGELGDVRVVAAVRYASN